MQSFCLSKIAQRRGGVHALRVLARRVSQRIVGAVNRRHAVNQQELFQYW